MFPWVDIFELFSAQTMFFIASLIRLLLLLLFLHFWDKACVESSYELTPSMPPAKWWVQCVTSSIILWYFYLPLWIIYDFVEFTLPLKHGVRFFVSGLRFAFNSNHQLKMCDYYELHHFLINFWIHYHYLFVFVLDFHIHLCQFHAHHCVLLIQYCL